MVFNNSILLGAAGQGGIPTFDPTTIGNSVWLNGSDEDLDRSTTSHSSTEMVVACWFQLNKIDTGSYGILTIGTGSSGSNQAGVYLSGSALQLYCNGYAAVTSNLFRDIGWYHVLASFKLDESFATDKGRLFINGEEVTSFSSDGRSSYGTSFNSTATQYVGSISTGNFFNGYIAQPIMLDGQSIQAGDVAITDFVDTFTFGTNGSQAIPKKNSNIAALASTAGGNSFCLDFADSSGTDAANLGNDISNNNKDLTPNSMSAANQSENTPSNTYATWNPIFGLFAGHAHTATLTEGNLRLASSTSNYSVTTSTLAMPAGSGKFAAKFTVNTLGGIYPVIGVYDMDGDTSAAFTGSSSSVGLRMDGQRYLDGNSASYGSAVSAGNTVEVELDMDNNTVEFLINGSAQGTISKTFTGTVVFMVQDGSNGSAIDVTAEFDYTPNDANFKNLNTANLTAPDYQGIDYFDATIYEGNGKGQRVGDFVPFTDSETVANSSIFNDDDTAHLTRTYTTPTAATAFTFSCWFKPGSSTNDQYFLSTGTNDASEGYIAINHSTGGGQIWIADPNAGASAFGVRTNGTFIDSSQWYHLCLGINSAASSGSRVKLEINGVEQTLVNDLGITTQIEPSTSQAMKLNGATDFTIGRRHRTGSDIYDGYMANVYFIDGEKKQASDFGQLDTSTNRWVAKAYTGDFNNNGYKLAFGTASTGNGNTNGVGTDTSGEGHNWAEQGFTTSDQVIDSPSQNFATIDPVMSNGATPLTLSEGNLTGVRSSSGFQQAYSSFSGFRMQENTGIYFAEVLVGSDTASFNIGVLSGDPPSSTNRYIGQDFGTYGYDNGSGNKVNNATGAAGGQYAAYGATYTAGDVIGIEIDTDTGSINFHKNGSDQGQAFTGVPGPYAFAIASESGGGPMTFNFGQQMVLGGSATTFNAAAGGRFKHTPPTGAKALNQDNLDDTASKITAWSWIKNRDATDSHILVDRVRGVGEVLHSDLTDLEATEPNTVQRFFQRGVQVGNDVQVNTANESYVLWQWLVGEAATTTTINASSTTPTNSIASTVAAADAGHFSVVGYQGNSTNGATVAHSLGGEPELIFFRGREGSGASSFLWRVFSTTGGAGKYLRLNDSTGLQDDTGYLNNTLPGSVVFTLGTDGDVNNSSYTYIAYCFRSVPGVCKVGSYTGNGDGTGSDTVDGPYVNCGFKPRWILFKWLSGGGLSAEGWVAKDTARQTVNPNDDADLIPNGSNAEAAGATHGADILSDGFKIRGGGGAVNKSAATYLYMAMADIGGNGTLPPIYGR